MSDVIDTFSEAFVKRAETLPVSSHRRIFNKNYLNMNGYCTFLKVGKIIVMEVRSLSF